MYNEKLEQLIDAALTDGELTEKEKQILFKKAMVMGIDLDEFEMVLDARLTKLQQEKKAKEQEAAPKSNKFGDVKKCPACGAIVQSFYGSCPECGYTFENVEANSAVKELSNLLQKATTSNDMAKIIDSFPIPMDKASLLSFITWLRPQSLDLKNPLVKSYQKKYAEAVNKAKLSFPADKQMAPLIAQQELDQKQIKKLSRRNTFLSLTIKNLYFWIGIILLIGGFYLFKPKVTRNPQLANLKIHEAIIKGDLDKAQGILIRFRGRGGVNSYRRHKTQKEVFSNGGVELIDAYLSQDNLSDAKNVSYICGFSAEDLEVRYYLEKGEYEKAFKNEIKYGKYLRRSEFKEIIIEMCDKGLDEEAKKMVNNYYSLLTIEEDGYENETNFYPYMIEEDTEKIKQKQEEARKELLDYIDSFNK